MEPGRKLSKGLESPGLVVAVLLLHRCKLIGFSFWQLESMLWPSSILAMRFEGTSPRRDLEIAEFYVVLIAANSVIYLFVGLLTCLCTPNG